MANAKKVNKNPKADLDINLSVVKSSSSLPDSSFSSHLKPSINATGIAIKINRNIKVVLNISALVILIFTSIC
jgi:hypothetical protein